MGLYIIGTPIGNMKDITYRAIEILNECDVILCEDTRCSLKLLNYYGIKKKLISYHKFNEFKILDRIILDIKCGNKYGIISDAGMPCISDPGQILVNKCIEEGIHVDVIPGACAVINGKILSGFYNEMFTFIGFLPKESKKLRDKINLIKNIKTVLVIYESPHRLIKTLNILGDEFGRETSIYIGRELTKMFEENFRGTIDDSIKYFSNDKIRGEYVICIENNEKIEVIEDIQIIEEFIKNRNLGITNKDNINKICNEYGIKKNYVYKLVTKEINLT
ncbi:16S rRNA (cytidine(1402)-2'-O)-methyltransferase [Candidatus Arthromitus sp. SFB-rat-Yit]|uniref:16S rRNA (cytidine(1402)-2'-O)-methyltransferase n=1 Tax=Candidatus Arthromitus sp. SFB-rat-Yit TaxID=1041504 RepID=UPI000227A63D|nr:16S rRNA (cytidine(1402)-2'-O)-methyltransferase [Candidatus Arthromitus sp. SFB-rat-Yit]BAK80603.1 tetrapyrrole (Corrin/Porphyrin) methylase [Candidatus Arthromitus sp. SFB-rat-Yit]